MEKNTIARRIESVFESFEKEIQAHRDLNVKRADGGWSVGEIGNHIVKSIGNDFGRTAKSERSYDEHADSIKQTFLNFDLKFTTAPPLEPTDKTYSERELIGELEDGKKRVLKLIEDDLTETCIDIELPVWGCLTKFEWLVLIENHIVRHTKQVKDFSKFEEVLLNQ